jgi:hypothetical protein
MKKIFSFDRLEGDIAVCISDDDIKVDVPVSQLGGMKVHDVFSAELDGEELSEIVPMPEERDRRLKANYERLHRLAKRKNMQ